MDVSPKDRRYNGPQITGVLNLPECFNSFNITDPITLQWQIYYFVKGCSKMATTQFHMKPSFMVVYNAQAFRMRAAVLLHAFSYTPTITTLAATS